MFKRSETDKRRILIIDISHMFYKYAYGGATQLTTTLKIDGVLTTVDTTLPAYTIKQIHRWSNGGINPTVVCFDSLGSNRSKKAYFVKGDTESNTQGTSYKEGRGRQSNNFYEGINLTFSLMLNGGVTCLKCDGYEADDLIYAAVIKAKETYPDLPIDIITGDQDLVPLVDDQVSVFLVSRKLTWAEDKSIEKLHYAQITPKNLSEYMEDLTEFKRLKVPYNTVLLKKLLRGKKADVIPPLPKFTPTKYNNLIDSMIADGVDLANTFRYGQQRVIVCNKYTKEEIPKEDIDKTPDEDKIIIYKDPVELDNICNVLSNYLDEEAISHVKYIYRGVNLNCAFTDLGTFNRKPVRMTSDVKGYSHFKLQEVLTDYKTQINLPMV